MAKVLPRDLSVLHSCVRTVRSLEKFLRERASDEASILGRADIDPPRRRGARVNLEMITE
jgi:hypothetical protein